MENPLDGIIPNFNAFGVEFTQMWQKLLAGGWALALLISICYLGYSIIQMGKARNDANPQFYENARSQMGRALVAFGCIAGLSIIVGAVLFFVSSAA